MENFNKGFTVLPHWLGNILQFLDLTKRQYQVVLLIIRLSHGCNRRWAKLKPYHLQILGITPPHASEVLCPLINKKIIEQRNENKEFRVNEEYLRKVIVPQLGLHLEMLQELVGRQLSKKPSQISIKNLPKVVVKEFPNWEGQDSQNSNIETFLNREGLGSENGTFTDSKDTINKNKYNDTKDQDSYKRSKKHIKPDAYYPQNETEYEMFESFRLLDDSNSDSFSFYIWALQKGLPASKFRDFREDILRTPSIKNKGSVFVRKVKEYFHDEN